MRGSFYYRPEPDRLLRSAFVQTKAKAPPAGRALALHPFVSGCTCYEAGVGLEEFLTKWHGTEGGAERANYGIFLTEFCQVLGLPDPGPANYDTETRGYQFEAFVRKSEAGEAAGTGRIDLYKPRHFVLEAKQSRLARKATPDLLAAAGIEPAPLQPAGPRYDALMRDARLQAEGYARALPASEGWPPFLIVCDVGRAFDIYFDWSGMGKDYGPFPDRQSYRIDLLQLRDPSVQELFEAIWTDPSSIDPRLKAVAVTRDVSWRLAQVSKILEENQRPRTKLATSAEKSRIVESTALYLMRILFCMFAEDVGLLPKDSFQKFLVSCMPPAGSDVDVAADEKRFTLGLQELWRLMGTRGGERYCFALGTEVRYFNGGLFENTEVYNLSVNEISRLVDAASKQWSSVEPAIFGTLLEQALTPEERAKLGAHYTPRPYVERLVEATIMEPLRAEWAAVQAGVATDANAAPVTAFHAHLKALRILDPACGTGNFLYVSMELLLRLEGEVLTLLAELGMEARPGIEPKQFLGLELNPRAAVIAELVLWIGWLRWRIANDPTAVPEPVLQRTDAINFGRHGGYDAVLARTDVGEVDFANPRPALWPEADFIIGNPPFIGKGSAMRSALGDDYCEALWRAHPDVPKSADFVMFWWDRAATLLTGAGARLKRFGLVTTNSITGSFNRRVVQRHLLSGAALTFAIPDHPWTKAAIDSAAVRIAMTTAQAGDSEGLLLRVTGESLLETDTPQIVTTAESGAINANLTVGADVGSVVPLRANAGISCNGMMLAGQGFKLTGKQAADLIGFDGDAARSVIRPYVGGSDLVQRSAGNFVIDLFGIGEANARRTVPTIYAHLLVAVKPERDVSRDAAFKRNWWLFGRSRQEHRETLLGLQRYIGTTETAKHRIFQFLPVATVPDHMVIAIALSDAFDLGVLSSRVHLEWTLRTGGWLGIGNDNRYNKSLVFDPFPFPDPTHVQRAAIAELGEEIDSTRKIVQAEHPDITLTGLYNLVEKLRAGTAFTVAEADSARRARAGIILELHRRLDVAVAAAYGWPADLAPAEIVARLVALNAERAAEEAAGNVRWLRPDYQAGRA